MPPFPFRPLIHSRADTRWQAKAKFEPGFDAKDFPGFKEKLATDRKMNSAEMKQGIGADRAPITS